MELVLFGAACYCFGLVSGAVVIPWLVDRASSGSARMGVNPLVVQRRAGMANWILAQVLAADLGQAVSSVGFHRVVLTVEAP